MVKITEVVKYLDSMPVEYHGLIEALLDLDRLIGMEKIKNKIAEMVCHAIIFPFLNKCTNYNVVIYGKPGVGKSLVIGILARIYASMNSLVPLKIKDTNNHLQWWLVFIREQMMASVEDLRESGHDSEVYQRLDWVHNICQELSDHYDCNKPKYKPKPASKIVYIRRSEVVGRYQGWTAQDTMKKLEEGKGGVVVIDECYSLLNGENDDFGTEALNVINQFITENPDTRFILAGYKDRIQKILFDQQEGLKSRFQWEMEIEGYSGFELAQMALRKLKINCDENVTAEWLGQLLKDNLHKFPAFGRSVENYHLQVMIDVAIRCVNELKGPEEAIVNRNDYISALQKMPHDEIGFLNSHIYS